MAHARSILGAMMLLVAAALASCPSETEALDAHLERWAADAATGRFGVSGLPVLVARPLADAAAPVIEGAELVVRPDGISVDGRATDPEWVVVALQKSPWIAMGMQKRDPRYLQVRIAVTPDAPWSRVVAAVDAVRQAHLDQVVFLFETPPEVEAGLAPPPSPVHAALAGLDGLAGPERLQEGVRVLSSVLQACPAAMDTLRGAVAQPAASRARWYADRLAPAVEGCGCRVDPASVAETFWYLDGRDRVYGVGVTLNARTLVAVAPTTLWRDAWPRVIDARGGAQLGFPTP